MGDLVATPRNYLTGLLADAAGGLNNFASKPFGYNNPPGNMLAGLLGIPAIANTLNELSYGGSLTTGSGMTTKPKADTADAVLAAAPFIPSAGRAVAGMPIGLSTKNVGAPLAQVMERKPFVYPRQAALDTAQKNAALPVEQGGLGLRPDNTPMERAQAMGYKTPGEDFYRGNHIAPMSESGAPAHDLTGGGNFYPDDVYSSRAAQYYGAGEPTDAALFRKLQALKGKPDESVRVFRAVPSNVMEEQGHRLNHGDWITPSRDYAVQHGEGALNGDYRIYAGNVPAKTIFTNGDSPYEFGYDATQRFAEGPASLPVMHSQQFQTLDRSKFAAFDPLKRNDPDLLGRADPALLGIIGAGGLLGLGAYNSK